VSGMGIQLIRDEGGIPLRRLLRDRTYGPTFPFRPVKRKTLRLNGRGLSDWLEETTRINDRTVHGADR